MSSKTLYFRSLVMAAIGGLLSGLSGMFLDVLQPLVVVFIGIFVAPILHKEKTLSQEKIPFYLWLMAIFTCLLMGLLSGIWHSGLCLLLSRAIPSTYCKFNHIQATVWASTAFSLICTFTLMLTHFFSNMQETLPELYRE